LFLVAIQGLAVLACNAAGSGALPTPTVAAPAATATTLEPTALPSATTGPVVPTETPTGGTDAEGLCVGPGAPTLPASAPAFADLPIAINDYLDAGGDTGTLTDALTTWGSIVTYGNVGPFGGVELHDFSGDGINEVLVTAVNPDGPPPVTQQPPPGGLVIYTCFQGHYIVAYSAWDPADRATGMPVPLAVEDVTGDGNPDLVATKTNCGAHTCYQSVLGATFDGPGDGMAPLVPPGQFIDAPSPDITVMDNTGDGVADVNVQTGYIGSVGAGPQRAYMDVYAWDGTALALVSHTLTSVEHLIHVANDGDALFAEGDYQGAIDQYQRVLTDGSLQRDLEMYDGANTDLESWAHYRIMLAYAALGQIDAASNAFNALDAAYPADPAQGEGWFAPLGRAFWQNYAVTADLTAACNDALGSLSISESYDIPLNQWGYANTLYEIADLCPFGSP